MAGKILLGGNELFPVAVARKLAALKPERMPDFSRIMVVLPGKIARQNLQKELLNSFPGGLLLPQLTTPHGLLYAGLENPGEVLSAAAEDILWGRAVSRALKKKEYFQNIFHNGALPPDPYSAGRVFSRFRKELTAGNLLISEAAEKLGSRGKELALLETFFLDELSAAGFCDQLSLDRQAASETGYFAGVEKVILAGLPDLPEIILQKVSAIDAAFPEKVEVWINNPPEEENIFDQWGKPLPDFWLNRAWQGTKENIHVALNPVDGARRAALLAAGDSGIFSPSECAVVLADPALYKEFAREFSRLKDSSGSPLLIADPSGIPMKLQRIWQLLRKLADHLKNPDDFFSASELLRERDFLLYTLNENETPGSVLALLDDFQQRFTPDDLNFIRKPASSGKYHGVIDRIFSRLAYWQKVFTGSDVADFLRKFLTGIYLKRENIENEIYNHIPFSSECDLVNAHINALENLPDSLKNPVSKIELLEIFLHNLGNEHLVYPIPDNAMAFEGRLEMPFLEQKKIIFCGMNEGFFPDVIQTTPFLTDSIRSELGIRSNRETLLRSICHLFSAKTGRDENDLQLIVLRQDSEKSTLKPSGILFNGDLDNEELLARCQYLFADPESLEVSKNECAGKKIKLKLPLDHRRSADGSLLLRVTDIDRYLDSPFEFFWSKVLENNTVDYSLCEPDAALTGTLIHAAFEELGSETFATAEKLQEKLVGNFRRVIHRHYGEELPLLIKLFEANIIQRLEYASTVLFDEQRSGFTVLRTEYPFGGDAASSLSCYGAVFRGKVDRIEYNPAEKIIRIVDIKTGKVDNVVSAHISKIGSMLKFKKLQLPLYALLLKKDEFFRQNILPEIDECRIECAYLTIPRSVTDCAMEVWKSEELSSILPDAENELLRIIAEIRELPENRLYMEPRKITSPWLKPNASQALCQIDFVQNVDGKGKEEKNIEKADSKGKSGKGKSAALPAEPERRFETLPEKKSASGCTRCCDCPEKFSTQCPCFHGDCVSCKSFNGFKSFNLITASAGTGKTYSLASRFIQLMEYGVDPESIMAVTFTKKAAGEIFDRIISRICDMIKNPEKAENRCRRYSADKLPGLLRQLVGSRSHSLQISTIDSFFMRIMQSFAPEFGIWGEISLVDENDDRYRRRTLRSWLKSLESGEEQDTLRELIKDADNSEAGEIYASLVSLVNSIYSYFQHNIEITSDRDIPQIALPVYPIPAADVMPPDECRNAVNQLREFALNIYRLAVPGANSRSVAALEKRLNALAEALEKSISGYFFHRLSDDVKSFVDALNKKNPDSVWCDADDSAPLAYVVALPDGLPGLLRRAMRHIRALAAYQARRKTLAVFALINKFDLIYSASVRNSGKLTFADLPAMLLAMDPDSRQALLGPADHSLEMRMDARFDHYMLDEFQDTSDVQMLALDPLFSEIFSTGNQGDRFRSFFCVGDLKQSIYQWRGGNPELFNYVANKLKILGNAGGYDPVDSLNLSYRSSQTVLDTVNAVFAPYSGNIPGFAEVLKKMDYRTHRSAKEELSGHAALFEVPQMPEDIDNIAAKAKIIMQIVKDVQPFERDLTVGILVQDNKFGRKVAAALRELTSVPVSIDGRISVSESMIFTVYKALLTLALHPGDGEAASFLSMLTMISPDGSEMVVTPEFITEKLNWNKNIPLPEAAAEALFYGKLSGFTSGFCAAFSRECCEADDFTLDVLCQAAENFSGTPEEFMQQLDKYGETARSVGNTIQIMTFHKSKGLEFDLVFLPQTGNRRGNHTKLTPESPIVHYAPDDESASLHHPVWTAYQPVDVISEMIPPFAARNREEKFSKSFEKCCNLYVAMTRAKRALYMLLSCSGTSSTLALDKLLQERLSLYGVCNADFELEKEFNIPDGRDVPVKITFSRGNRHWYSEVPFAGKKVSQPINLPTVKIPEKEAVSRASDGKDGIFIPAAERRFSGFSAKDTGTEVHDIFSRISFIGEDFDAAEFSAGASLEAREIFVSAMEESSPIREALKHPGIDVEVWQEKRFILRNEDGSVTPGAFDRVVIFRDGGKISHAEIIDYKSDNFKSVKDCSIYAGQLEKYRHSLAALLDIDEKNISCRIYALKLKTIVEV
ncbi:MAG: UvrD-helicase domain-containing protein [Lentisphaeria bacterium]|nr:UvrD-helicase domain-containing protein [Lentisphaeria bacterium]